MSIANGNEIFPMEDSEAWGYQVKVYLAGHSQLQIQVTNQKTGQILYINFISVEFYDGPLDWSGKGFSIGDSTECLQILKRLEPFRNDPQRALREGYSLYVAEPENGYRVRVIAGNKPTLTEENLFAAYVP